MRVRGLKGALMQTADQRHFLKRPSLPRLRIKSPIDSFESVNTTVNDISSPLTWPSKRAGRPWRVIPMRIGPGPSIMWLPVRLNFRSASNVSLLAIDPWAQSYSIVAPFAVTIIRMCCPPHVPSATERCGRDFFLSIDESFIFIDPKESE